MSDRRGEGWTAGVGASLQSLLEDPACPDLLRRALRAVPSWQLRSETTVGRVLRASSLMPQCLAALLALGAVVTLESESGSQGADEEGGEAVCLEDVLHGTTAGEPTALHIPAGRLPTGWGRAAVARTPADDPIVAAFAAAWVGEDGVAQARVALTGVWSEPVRLARAPQGLVGGPLSQERIETVAADVEREVEPEGDYRGGEGYRRAMAGVVTRRALEDCVASQAGGGAR